MKKIAAPRPLKRSGVVPTARMRGEMAYFRDDESTSGRNERYEDLYNDVTNGGEEEAVRDVLAASYRFASKLDDESIEMEGSCEIQRIFLSGFHTPGPRGANDEDDDGDRDSRLYFLSETHATQSPSFQFFIPAPTRSYAHEGTYDEDDVYAISSDFPLLGHSPYQPNNTSDDESSYFEAYHYPRAANPMPLNTPFHASLANDGPSTLYESQHLVVGTRGHFYTLPSGGTRPHKASDAHLQQQYHNWEGAAEENDPHNVGEMNRTTRNRSYSEPIPFVPAATPTRG
ncbi:uncharacterized protein ACA1_113450 [Acanthamoeba castellanii str. Neff]|uniref:Uncharacterized protein n=1 Tax=Acanthamoeba castellanii (strain ATCC 30010 / Neff) TaxID=1257118 RepID=L8H491_ACACF|nr:uncharacterized protein ACA1_113450 [Acanthamoeba castellanii str. Neff]ELR20000.1 hypothetical protein ACA1_113450 [Acanthamoeba castellanii str. Neff]